MLQGELDDVALAMHPKFAHDSMEMVARRDIANPKGRGNLPRRLALYQEAEAFFSPGRQRREKGRGLQGALDQGLLRAGQLRRSTEDLLNAGLITQLVCSVPKEMNGGHRPVALQGHEDAHIEQDGDTRFRPP